jgi:regulation of enolase protein 1 (concanavalin A-like superfamily)
MGVFSDGSSAAAANSTITWSSSNSAVLNISSAGLVTAVGAGVANVNARIGAVGSTPWTVTVSPAAIMLSAYLGATGNANKLIVGQTLAFSAIGMYSDGSSAVAANSAITWSSSNSAVLNISSAGLATAVGAGVANVNAKIGALNSSPWTMTVTPAITAPPAPGSVPAAAGAPVGDTFLGPFWQTINPTGGSTSISNAHLFIGVPGGSNHDPNSPSNQSVRVVQAIGDENFAVSIKIDSPLVATDASTSEGLMVLRDDKDFITFALTTDGTKIGLSAQITTGGVASTVLDDTDFSAYQNPMYLRLTRTGSAYVAFYSVDGTNWMQASRFTYTDVPTQIGPFASNYNDTPANAVPVVMSVNGFNVQ